MRAPAITLFICLVLAQTASARSTTASNAAGGAGAPEAAAGLDTAASDKCSTATSQFDKANAPKFLGVSPVSLYEGSILPIQLTGNNLVATWNLLLCPQGPTATGAPQPSVTPMGPPSSSASAIKGTLTAGPGSSGLYSVFVVDKDNKIYDTEKKIVINSVDDTKYIPCAAPNGTAPVNANLLCSFSPDSYEVELASFGKGVADRFIAVYVDIQNKNQQLEYLLQDVRGGFPDYVVSSYDKAVPRDVSVKAEQFSARAIVFRLTAASASVLTGIAGFAGSTVLQQAANLFAGPAQAGLQTAIPDLSSTELSNLDQLAFSVNSTVIPKGGAIRVVAFLPSEILPVAESNKGKKHLMSHSSFSTYKGDELRTLFKMMTITVAGIHVQQVTPAPLPVLKLFVPPLPALSDLKKASSFIIQGSGLDSVKNVELVGGDNKTIILASLQPLPNSTSKAIDPSLAVLAIPASDSAGSGTYEIDFVLVDGKVIDTGKSIVVPSEKEPPSVAPILKTATVAAIPMPKPAVKTTLSVAGSNLVQGDTIVVFGSGAKSVSFPVSTTDGKSGTAQVTLPSDYSATTKVLLQSKANSALVSEAILVTVH